MGGQVSTIKAAAGKLGDNKKRSGRGDKAKISILAFEVANVMSKSIVLWQSLSDQEIIRLRTEVIKAEGVLKLVSDSEAVLLSLACREKLQDLMALAGSVARLGKKCQEPALQGFEHVFSDILKQNIDVSALEYSIKEMEAKVKKMERYIATTSNLYQELEILADLEQAVRRIQDDDDAAQRDNLSALEQKSSWQRQEIKYLRDLSLWNRTYDKIVTLLARTICTIHGRIVCVFGPPAFDMAEPVAVLRNGECNRFSAQLAPHLPTQGSFLQFCSPSGGVSQASSTFVDAMGPSQSSSSPSSGTETTSQASPVNSELRLSTEVDSGVQAKSIGCEDSSRIDAPAAAAAACDGYQKPNGYQNGHHGPAVYKQPPGQQQQQQQKQLFYPNGRLNRLFFDPKFIHQSAPSSTLGGSALALHYANVIIIVEKMVKFPQLVGNDARDDLYRMLPKNVRLGLRCRLRTCFRAASDAMVRLDGSTTAAWRENLDHILSWLAPLAHNMIRWQSEHNFEQQVVSRTNVLLLQTLYFADQVKAEAAIVELLVGLNYLCWYEKEMKASMPLEYAASKDLDEYLDWQF